MANNVSTVNNCPDLSANNYLKAFSTTLYSVSMDTVILPVLTMFSHLILLGGLFDVDCKYLLVGNTALRWRHRGLLY